MSHTPGTEAIHHRVVRSPQRGRVRVAGQVKAVAFGKLGWSVCSPHALLNVARRLLDPHPYSPESLEGLFCVLRPWRLLRTQRPGSRKNIPNWERSSLRELLPLACAGRALQSSVGREDVEVVSALEVGFERATHALGDVAPYRG